MLGLPFMYQQLRLVNILHGGDHQRPDPAVKHTLTLAVMVVLPHPLLWN